MDLRYFLVCCLAIAAIVLILNPFAHLREATPYYVLNVSGYEFVFTTNPKEAMRFPSEGEEEIKLLFDRAELVCFDFINQSEEDNAYFAKIGFNLVFKLTRYYSLLGVRKGFKVCKEEPKILMLGPNSGASRNGIRLENATVVVEATSYKALELAGDKLALIVMGVKEV